MLQLHVQSFVIYFGIIVNYKIHNFTKLFLNHSWIIESQKLIKHILRVICKLHIYPLMKSYIIIMVIIMFGFNPGLWYKISLNPLHSVTRCWLLKSDQSLPC